MSHSAVPPGPRWPRLVQTLATVFAREAFSRYCTSRFGPVIRVRFLGMGEFVVVSDPELVREVFTGDRDLLRGGEANAVAMGGFLRSSVLVVDGERHLRLRRLMLPPFHGEAVRRYGEEVAAIALAEVRRWPVDEEFQVLPRMQALTLEAILRVVIGVRDERRLERFLAVMPAVLGVNQVGIFLETAYPKVAGSMVGRQVPWLRVRREADRLLFEEIAAHRASPEGREDVLALLIAARDEQGESLNDEELRDQLFTLLLAGHETTATALGWCFERLVRHPAVLTRLRRELVEAEDGGEAYMEAVINETLRVRPVLDGTARRLSAPFDLGHYTLPAGTMVAVSINGVQHSEAFSEALRFDPDRFLGQPPAPYSMIPFGGGTRRCIGASFAMMEMKAVLRTVIENVELGTSTHRPERPTRWRRITTIPSHGARVVVAAKY